jgi:hypothetical protein
MSAYGLFLQYYGAANFALLIGDHTPNYYRDLPSAKACSDREQEYQPVAGRMAGSCENSPRQIQLGPSLKAWLVSEGNDLLLIDLSGCRNIPSRGWSVHVIMYNVRSDSGNRSLSQLSDARDTFKRREWGKPGLGDTEWPDRSSLSGPYRRGRMPEKTVPSVVSFRYISWHRVRSLQVPAVTP